MLYTTQSGLRAWLVDERSGMLSLQQKLPLDEPGQIVVAGDGENVYILGGTRMQRITTDRATGGLQTKATVAAVIQPRSVALKTI
jgi:hypothetical protein